MINLLLLRHAQTTNPATGQKDHERVLTNLGEKQAFIMGEYLKEQNIIPNFIVSSDSTRTKQTASFLQEGLKQTIKYETIPSLYNCSCEKLLLEIEQIDPIHETVLVINHNPGIHQLAFELSKGNRELSMNYPPCSLTHFKCLEGNQAITFHAFKNGNEFLRSF